MWVLDAFLHPHQEGHRLAAVDDAVAAYRALLDNTPASRIVVAGDSAGGGLSLALLQRLREEGLPMPAGAALLSPWGDLSGSLPAYTREADREPLLYVPTLRECAVNYAGETPLEHPQLSPIHADYQGLPPLLIQATDAEVLAAFWEPLPRPGFHDIFGLVKIGRARIDGDILMLVKNLRFFKEFLALGRTEVAA